MKVTVILIVISALVTVTRWVIQGLYDLLKRSARILRRVLDTWGELMSLKLQGEIIGKRLKKNNNNNNDNNNNNYHVVPLAQKSLTLSRHFSIPFIASGSSSGLHPVSSHSCWMYVRGGRFALARPYVGVDRSTSLMSSSLLLQQCPACLVRLTLIVFVKGRQVAV